MIIAWPWIALGALIFGVLFGYGMAAAKYQQMYESWRDS